MELLPQSHWIRSLIRPMGRDLFDMSMGVGKVYIVNSILFCKVFFFFFFYFILFINFFFRKKGLNIRIIPYFLRYLIFIWKKKYNSSFCNDLFLCKHFFV